MYEKGSFRRYRHELRGLLCARGEERREAAGDKRGFRKFIEEQHDRRVRRGRADFGGNRRGEAALTSEGIVEAVVKAGYGASLREEKGSAGPKAKAAPSPVDIAKREYEKIWRRLMASVVFAVPLFYISMGHMMGWPLPAFFHGTENAMIFALTLFLLTVPIVFINFKFFRVGFTSLAHGAPNMDSLIALGSSAALVYGVYALYKIAFGLGHGDLEMVRMFSMDLYFESAGMILTLITVGKFFEARAKGRTSDAINKLMNTLIEAIYTFVLARAIRNARRESSEHCSMLIHISLKKIDHAVLMKKVESVVTDLLNSIDSFIALESPELKDSHIKRLKDVWDKQYEGTGISETWGGICSEMRRDGFTESFKVYKLNSDLKSNEDELCELDYDKSPGQSPIIIGGNRLSRGLTFEGLIVSYFLRRSSQYDTLMQMGRWFGYRDGYAEICRVFIPLSLQACFSEIAQATEELKSSIDDMLHSGMSPLEFGLRVRNNIPGLQVTARNKMRHTMIQHENLDFTDSYLSSYRVPSSPDSIKSNNLALEKFIAKLNKKYHLREASEDEVQVGKIWEGVAASDIIDYMQECCDMKSHSYFDPSCLEDYVSKVGVLDVAFIDKDDQFTGTNSDMGTMNIDGLGKVCLPVRVPYTDSEGFIHFKKNRVFSRHHELGHQTKEDIESWKRHYVEDKKVKTVTIHDLPSRYYRKKAGRRDLMLISFVRIPGRDLFDHEGKAVKTLKEMSEEDLSRRVAVYGFSFSWRKEEEYRATKYVVNAVIMDRVKSDEEDDE